MKDFHRIAGNAFRSENPAHPRPAIAIDSGNLVVLRRLEHGPQRILLPAFNDALLALVRDNQPLRIERQ